MLINGIFAGAKVRIILDIKVKKRSEFIETTSFSLFLLVLFHDLSFRNSNSLEVKRKLKRSYRCAWKLKGQM